MAQSTFSVRMDETERCKHTLKKQFDELCNDFGMNSTTAFNVFARAVVRERRIPFEITSSNIESKPTKNSFELLREQAINSDVSDLSLEEINAEIDKSRNERAIK